MARAPVVHPDEALLVARYTPLVRRIAGALQGMKPAVLDPDDVFQDGMIGLLRAIRGNRSAVSDAQFAVYASMNIRGAIVDGYREAGEQSRAAYRQAKRVREAVLAGEDVAPEARRKAEQFLAEAWSRPACLDPEVPGGVAPLDPQPGPEQRTEANQLLRRAIDALQQCPLRDRNIFIACELNGDVQSEVARRYRLSGGRISQIIREVRARVLLALA